MFLRLSLEFSLEVALKGVVMTENVRQNIVLILARKNGDECT